jgi:hypothetical protein
VPLILLLPIKVLAVPYLVAAAVRAVLTVTAQVVKDSVWWGYHRSNGGCAPVRGSRGTVDAAATPGGRPGDKWLRSKSSGARCDIVINDSMNIVVLMLVHGGRDSVI